MATIAQREELHRTIWAMADELRGAVGGWEFKAYVLGTLFYRFISENLTDYIGIFSLRERESRVYFRNFM